MRKNMKEKKQILKNICDLYKEGKINSKVKMSLKELIISDSNKIIRFY